MHAHATLRTVVDLGGCFTEPRCSSHQRPNTRGGDETDETYYPYQNANKPQKPFHQPHNLTSSPLAVLSPRPKTQPIIAPLGSPDKERARADGSAALPHAQAPSLQTHRPASTRPPTTRRPRTRDETRRDVRIRKSASEDSQHVLRYGVVAAGMAVETRWCCKHMYLSDDAWLRCIAHIILTHSTVTSQSPSFRSFPRPVFRPDEQRERAAALL